MSQLDWTVVTVTYNSADQLRAHWDAWPRDAAQWLVVDNASVDDSVSVARSLGAEVIELDNNRGFGAANNVALEAADGDWILFANPDLRVDPIDLPRLARVGMTNQSLVAPQLINPDGSMQGNARGLPHLSDKVANRLGRWPGSRLNDYVRDDLDCTTHVAWTIGAAIAGPADLLSDLGGWNENYFIYYEDHDLGLRSWLHGAGVVIDPTVRWTHEWQRATTLPRWTPWKHEIASMRTFYGDYPDLLTKRRSSRSQRWEDLRSQLWRSASDPDINA